MASRRGLVDQHAQEGGCTTDVECTPIEQAPAVPVGRRWSPIAVLAASAAGLGAAGAALALAATTGSAGAARRAAEAAAAWRPAVISGFAASLKGSAAEQLSCPEPFVQLGELGADVPGWGLPVPEGNSATSIDDCARQCTESSQCVAFEYKVGFQYQPSDDPGSVQSINVCVLNRVDQATTEAQTVNEPGLITCTSGCSVIDGSNASMYYPCVCNASTCGQEGMICTWATSHCELPTAGPTEPDTAGRTAAATPEVSTPAPEPEGWTLIEGTGCDDWRSIMLSEASEMDLVSCKLECLKHPLCASINYQSGPIEDCPLGGLAKTFCYLFAGEWVAGQDHGSLKCRQEPNPCWDLHVRPAPGAPMALPPGRLRQSCANVADIQIGEGEKVLSKYECAEKCRTTADCEAFLHQPGECPGYKTHPDINWCILLQEGCEEAYEACQDLYCMDAAQAAPPCSDGSAPAPAPIPRDLDCVENAAHCSAAWSEQKKKDCCDQGKFCCDQATAPPPQFDCSEFDQAGCSSWSAGQRVWCKSKGQECTAASGDDR